MEIQRELDLLSFVISSSGGNGAGGHSQNGTFSVGEFFFSFSYSRFIQSKVCVFQIFIVMIAMNIMADRCARSRYLCRSSAISYVAFIYLWQSLRRQSHNLLQFFTGFSLLSPLFPCTVITLGRTWRRINETRNFVSPACHRRRWMVSVCVCLHRGKEDDTAPSYLAPSVKSRN